MSTTDREIQIAELEDQHAAARAVITEKGGVVPLDMRRPLLELEAELRRQRTLKAAEEKGHESSPRPGEIYYVTAMPRLGSKGRNRRGLRFENGVRRKVEVVEPAADKVMERRVQNGESIATPDGMLEILADPDLTATMSSASDNDLARVAAERDAAEARAVAAERELAELKASARRNAQDSNDGRPARLQAAQKAEAEATEKMADKPTEKLDEPKGKGGKG